MSQCTSNAIASDFILLTLLWGMRRGECATFQWRDRISDKEAPTARWIDMKLLVAHIGDGKNRGDHEFPISKCAVQILKRRRADEIEGQSWVFPAQSLLSLRPYYSDPTQALKTV